MSEFSLITRKTYSIMRSSDLEDVADRGKVGQA